MQGPWRGIGGLWVLQRPQWDPLRSLDPAGQAELLNRWDSHCSGTDVMHFRKS